MNTVLLEHLLPRISFSVIWICVALICVDIFFIAVFAVDEMLSFLADGNRDRLGREWNIAYDWSYAEIFGYFKSILILGALISIPQVWKRPVYLAFVAIFVFVLLDDALELHERFGAQIATVLGFRSFGGLRAQDPGEVLVWIMAGIPLLGAAALAIARAPKEDRRNGVLLTAGLALLALFAVVADMAHEVLQNAFRGANDLFTLIEDGGEQITLSLICGLAILIHHEVRGRVRGRFVPV
jgi:hypothetical protein